MGKIKTVSVKYDVWYILSYTQQQLIRHYKPEEPMNKQKEVEFLYMLEG